MLQKLQGFIQIKARDQHRPTYQLDRSLLLRCMNYNPHRLLSVLQSSEEYKQLYRDLDLDEEVEQKPTYEKREK